MHGYGSRGLQTEGLAKKDWRELVAGDLKTVKEGRARQKRMATKIVSFLIK
jgi:hypothetical protein